MAGAFSEDFQQLLIGDATGKVHLLGVDDSDILNDSPKKPHSFQAKEQLQRGGILATNIRRPKVLIHHPEPEPPAGYQKAEKEFTGKDLADELVKNGIVAITKDIGAVQSEHYHESNWYRREAHVGEDPTAPLIPEVHAKQQSVVRQVLPRLRLPILAKVTRADPALHEENVKKNLDIAKLDPETLAELRRDRVELDWDDAHPFPYENRESPGQNFEIFKEDTDTKVSRKAERQKAEKLERFQSLE